jgi:hypothetical protein
VRQQLKGKEMFADDLVADKMLLASYDGMSKVFRRIDAAQKFVLSKEFTVAADGLVENHPELRKIVPYCRVPYPATWVEWLHDDRPHWNPAGPHKAREIDPTRHQGAPQRVAMLLEQMDGFAGKWKAHLFWSFKERQEVGSQTNGSLMSMIMDIRRVGLSDDPLVDSLSERAFADFGTELLAKTPLHIIKRLGEYANEDWGGELRFMIAMLGLLNTRNVVQFEDVDKTAFNKKRAKHGKQPLFSHKILKIRPRIIVRSGGEGSGEHRNLRQHFVMGHFKHRKTGLFYWSHHLRGKLEYGIIEKDYEVT